MPVDVAAYLAEQQNKTSGDVSATFLKLEELYNKKLWHQLTLTLQDFVKNPCFSSGHGLTRMYDNFIADFEHRINPLSLMEIVVFVVKQISDPDKATAFLDKIQTKVKTHEVANILCLTAIANVKLQQKKMGEVKVMVSQVDSMLDRLDGVTAVHHRFYELSSNFHKLMGNHAEYYKDALRYLGCCSLSTLTVATKQERAFNLGLAALLGKGIYNFGELLAHPVIETLWETEQSWLVELLLAFNAGDLAKFEGLKEKWTSQPDLKHHQAFLREKISLLCLMEMSFKRPSKNRRMTFSEVAKTAEIQLDEVELLVMKALSLGLLKGTIDQVEQCVLITWVQPRVLDKTQIGTLRDKLLQWTQDVNQMEQIVEENAQPILSQ